MGEKRCLGCMERFSVKLKMCPFCGYVVNTPVENAVHMEPGTILADRYLVGKVLGYGGFGVTYVGWDGTLCQKVAIKEYFPTEFSTRMPGKTMLTLSNDKKKREQFACGLSKFVEEAKRLAKFQNIPGIVKIFNAFEENDTAYIIMEYLEGETLTDLLDRVGVMEEDQAVKMLLPIMKSLEIVHKAGIIHRDIAPDNVFITKNGDAKLIDFGASRYATTSHSRSITVIIKPGYSPEEQYRSRGDQGTYTDVYALAATLYKMVTGVVPPDALERRTSCEKKRRDLIKPPHLINRKVSKNIENALLNALNVRIEDRTVDIEHFIQELEANPPAKRRYGNIKKIDLYHWPLWTKIAIPAAALMIIAGGIFAISTIVHLSPPEEAVIPDGMVAVPSVEGETMSDATNIIKKGDLNATIAGNIESDYIEANKIVLQDPFGGSYQDRYSNVNIWVSGGKVVENVVPLLIGSTEEQALQKLQEAGFTNVKKAGEEYNDDVEEGLVTSQTPESTGEKVSPDIEVSFILSLGPKPFEMISVVGQTVEEAKKALESTGLQIKYGYTTGEDKDVGKIKEQSVPSGQLVKKGDIVILTVITKKLVIDVEDVVGLDKADAETRLQAKGFKVNSGAEEYSDDYPKGRVIRQNPVAGTSQTEGTTITIVISKGPEETSVVTPTEPETSEKVSVANVVGSVKNVAVATLANQGFAVSIRTEYSADYAAGYVMKQTPEAGSSQKKGSTVTITVSGGIQKVSVPNVIGKNTSAAKSELESAGFSVVISETYYTKETKGTVFSQSPNYGTMAEKGTTVTLMVSLGEAPAATVAVPSVVGKTKAEATSILEKAGLTVGVIENYSDTVASGYVINQSPSSGNRVDKNAKVLLIVSKGPEKITVPNVVGKLRSTAETTLKDEGFQVSVTEAYSDTISAGYVISQTPSSGNKEPKNSTVSLVVSKGPQLFSVPDVVGKTKSAAETALKDAGFRVSVTETYSDTVASGYVIFQSPASGSAVAKNTLVTISVSKGKKAITVTLNANGGTVSKTSITVYKGSSYGSLPTPKRDYYQFAGWYTSASGGTKVTSSTTVSNSSNHTLYAHWTENPTSDWVSASEVPSGAKIVDQKWKYTYTTYSDRWERTGGGTYYFGSFPDGYNTNDQYYWMNRGALTAYDNGNTKRDVGKAVFNSYVYWHWCYYTGAGSENNRYMGSYYNEPIYGNDGSFRGYATIWESFESTEEGSSNGDGKTYKFTGHSSESWHWFRVNIYRQDYTEYKKVTDSSSSEKESSTEVTAGGNISNVRKYVKYRAK